MTDDDFQPVEIDAQRANSASTALNALGGDLQMADHPLGETIKWFAEQYGQHRVEAPHNDDGTVTLHLPPETYRTIAGALRMEALRRNTQAAERDLGGMSEMMADDYRELAQLFDRAAREAEGA